MIIGFHANWLVFPNMVTCTLLMHLNLSHLSVCPDNLCVCHASKVMRSVLVSVWLYIHIRVCVCVCAPKISGKLGCNLPKIVAVNSAKCISLFLPYLLSHHFLATLLSCYSRQLCKGRKIAMSLLQFFQACHYGCG